MPARPLPAPPRRHAGDPHATAGAPCARSGGRGCERRRARATTIAVARPSNRPSGAPLPGFDSEAGGQSLLVCADEASYRHRLPLVGRTDLHPLVQAAYTAFTQRYPLVLSPDVVWLCLARGFTFHLAANDEQRRRFLPDNHEFALVADRPDFTLGEVNPWPALFPDFSRQISARVGSLRDLVTSTFSTTGPVERVSSELTVATPLAPHHAWEAAVPGRHGVPAARDPARVPARHVRRLALGAPARGDARLRRARSMDPRAPARARPDRRLGGGARRHDVLARVLPVRELGRRADRVDPRAVSLPARLAQRLLRPESLYRDMARAMADGGGPERRARGLSGTRRDRGSPRCRPA